MHYAIRLHLRPSQKRRLLGRTTPVSRREGVGSGGGREMFKGSWLLLRKHWEIFECGEICVGESMSV